MDRAREQRLIDMMFEMAVGYKDYLAPMTRDEIGAWVAHQLRNAGFHTIPMGTTWGVLIDKPENSPYNIGNIEIVESERPE